MVCVSWKDSNDSTFILSPTNKLLKLGGSLDNVAQELKKSVRNISLYFGFMLFRECD
jgi:hypothetical protein